MMAVTLGLAAPQFNGGNGGPTTAGGRIGPIERGGPNDGPSMTPEMEARQWKRLRQEHQKEVFSDTNRLVQLATDLKAEVDKGSKSPTDVIKDVDEIGKLAKRVSDRIKTQ
jgi:hypothetical protein